jgi:hypothetical protein
MAIYDHPFLTSKDFKDISIKKIIVELPEIIIYEPDLQLDEIEIDVSKEGDVKNIWTKINEYLPLYFLFQSDRRNNSEDNEIQDPLKTALEQILKDDSLVKRLNEIARDVESKLKEVLLL